MSLRITQDILYKNSLLYLQRGLQRIESAQEPLLTGKRINRPSDDPFGAIRVLKFHVEQNQYTNYLNNIDMVTGLNESGAAALQSLSTLLADAKALTIQGASSGMNQADRDTLASQIEGILGESISLANTRFGNRYLFGGTLTDSPPFLYNGSDEVEYVGNSDVNSVWISSSTKTPINIPGDQIFQKMGRGTTLYEGDTGAAPGTGTDSGRNNATLQVIHGVTTYAAGTGVAAGASSATGDTIIGAAGTHTLTLTVTSPTTGTLSLDGGPDVSYDTTAPGANDFMVTNADGDRVYLDLTGALSSGTVDITSTGFLSLDGGATQTAIDFSTNQVISNTVDGTTTNVNSSGITRTGGEYLTYSGTFDLFEVLIAIRDDLRNTRGLSGEDQLHSIASRMYELDDVHEDVLASLAEFGGRTKRLDLTSNRLKEFEINLLSITANIEEADLTEAIMELELANQAMEVAQSVTTQILGATILNRYQ
jgi:flagellar hook-associated protein 3